MPHELERVVDATWAARMRDASVRLYNATKFRYAGHSRDDDGTVTLHLGLSDYRHHVAAMTPAWAALAPLLDDAQHERLWPRILGCAAIVETADGHVLLQRRSAQVAELPGALALPGGHPEPAHVGLPDLDADLCVTSADAVAAELFASATAEVVEELGVAAEQLSTPLLLGIVQRRDSSRYVMAFLLRTPLSLAEVTAVVARGHAQDAYETAELASIACAELARLGWEPPDGLTACTVGCLQLYRQMLQSD